MRNTVLGLMVGVFAMAMVAAEAGVNMKGKGKEKDDSSTVTGELAVVRNANGEVVSATITTKSGTIYNITIAGLVQDLGPLDGKRVICRGEVKDDSGRMVLTVKGEVAVARERKEKKEKKDKKQ